MIFPIRAPRWAMLPQRIRGMFNLNDPRWGRGDDKPSDDAHRPGGADVDAPLCRFPPRPIPAMTGL
mgnify:CR=1 FL=1